MTSNVWAIGGIGGGSGGGTGAPIQAGDVINTTVTLSNEVCPEPADEESDSIEAGTLTIIDVAAGVFSAELRVAESNQNSSCQEDSVVFFNNVPIDANGNFSASGLQGANPAPGTPPLAMPLSP